MCHVLVIEDEWLIAEHVSEIAFTAGATSVDTAANEADAIEAARIHPPAIILSDVKLARGTGPAAVHAIHKALGPIPVIFITATPEDCQPCNPPGIILGKPLDREAIIKAFRRFAPI